MRIINILGSELRLIRKAASESLAETAMAIGVDRSHLNKIELGAYKPSVELLESIIAHFSVEGSKASQLRLLVKEESFDPVVTGLQVEQSEAGSEEQEGVTPMAHAALPVQQPSKQIMMNPAQTPVLYTDSTFVTSSDYGLVLDIAQTLPGNNQQQVVARVGMSFDHAKKLIEIMHDHLQKNER